MLFEVGGATDDKALWDTYFTLQFDRKVGRGEKGRGGDASIAARDSTALSLHMPEFRNEPKCIIARPSLLSIIFWFSVKLCCRYTDVRKHRWKNEWKYEWSMKKNIILWIINGLLMWGNPNLMYIVQNLHHIVCSCQSKFHSFSCLVFIQKSLFQNGKIITKISWKCPHQLFWI